MNFNPHEDKQILSAIAKIMGAPIANVTANYPLLYDALGVKKMTDKFPLILALATVGTESGKFAVIHEHGDRAYFDKTYGPG